MTDVDETHPADDADVAEPDSSGVADTAVADSGAGPDQDPLAADVVDEAALEGLTEVPPGESTASLADRVKQLEREGDIAADYLEELLDIADLDGDLDMDVDGDRASVSIVGGDLSTLVGGHGEVLDALQELTRLAVLRETGERSRLMLDIGGHRVERRRVLAGIAEKAMAEVRASGEPVKLDPMSPFERKVVHDAVAEAGFASDSEGVEPKRYVVVKPA